MNWLNNMVRNFFRNAVDDLNWIARLVVAGGILMILGGHMTVPEIEANAAQAVVDTTTIFQNIVDDMIIVITNPWTLSIYGVGALIVLAVVVHERRRRRASQDDWPYQKPTGAVDPSAQPGSETSKGINSQP